MWEKVEARIDGTVPSARRVGRRLEQANQGSLPASTGNLPITDVYDLRDCMVLCQIIRKQQDDQDDACPPSSAAVGICWRQNSARKHSKPARPHLCSTVLVVSMAGTVSSNLPSPCAARVGLSPALSYPRVEEPSVLIVCIPAQTYAVLRLQVGRPRYVS
jgi:hypothetical protein